jgi:ATP synthase protein I
MTPAPEQRKSWGTVYGPYLTLGIQLAVTVIAFFFIGRWLDSKLDTAPWLMLAGLGVGITGGLISFFRTVIALGRKEDSEAEQRRKESQSER